MQTMRDIKIRLKSINSTKQITESMRLIATRKVQKIRLRLHENKPYLKQTAEIIKQLTDDKSFDFNNHPYITGRNAEKALVILITGDRGLCAGYNVNVQKEALKLNATLKNPEYITIGSKGYVFLARRVGKDKILKQYDGLSENPIYEHAQMISQVVFEKFNNPDIEKRVDKIYLVHTRYISMISQEPTCVQLLPYTRDNSSVGESEIGGGGKSQSYDTDQAVYFEHAVSTHVTSVLFSAMLESAAAEQCARVTGMDSASKNSEKIMDTLTLQYNQMRQGAITQEIAEIVGGAAATSK